MEFHEKTAKKIKSLLMELINITLLIVELFLWARFILRMLGANPKTPFVDFILSSSSELLTPFSGIFASGIIKPGIVVEFSTLFAIVIYPFLAYLIIKFINWVEWILKTAGTEN